MAASTSVPGGADGDRESFGILVHEIRNLLNTAMLAFEALNTGNVGVRGSTGNVLKRSLAKMRDLANQSIAEVRVLNNLQARAPIVVAELIDEVAAEAALDAASRDLGFTGEACDADLAVLGDRPVMAAIVTNLLQNAFKYTRPRTTVSLSVKASEDQVVIEVADACGGLHGDAEQLFQPFARRSGDPSGLGLGLTFSRRAAEASGGRLVVRNLPGHGCVFALEMPRIVAAGEPGALAS